MALCARVPVRFHPQRIVSLVAQSSLVPRSSIAPGFLLPKTPFHANLNRREIHVTASRSLHLCPVLCRGEDRKQLLASVPKKDEGVQGEDAVNIDYISSGKCIFPDEDTPNMPIDGVRFAELHICHIHVSPNNTIMDLTDHTGRVLVIRSGGMEGFKNTKKGTNVAAQATGISLASRMAKLGIKNVRVVVKGLGPGRMASVKGLEMGGINIVSITDNTPVPMPGSRARKRKKI